MVIITGSNGFLGSEIANVFRAANLNFRSTDVHANPQIPTKDYFSLDIVDRTKMKEAFAGASCVIHAAGLAHVHKPDSTTIELLRQINEVGTVNVISAAAGSGANHFVLISSVSVYGLFTKGMFDEHVPCNPLGPYALSKFNAELRAQEIAEKYRMALTILRLATLYGEGDPGNVGRLIRTLDSGRFLWIGDGMNFKSLLYKGDAARACYEVAVRPAIGFNVYNVSAPPCTMRDIVDGLGMALGKKPLPGRIPASIAMAAAKAFSMFPIKRLLTLQATIGKWLGDDTYDTGRFEADYGFHTEVGLLEGLKREVEWYRQNQGITGY